MKMCAKNEKRALSSFLGVHVCPLLHTNQCVFDSRAPYRHCGHQEGKKNVVPFNTYNNNKLVGFCSLKNTHKNKRKKYKSLTKSRREKGTQNNFCFVLCNIFISAKDLLFLTPAQELHRQESAYCRAGT